MANAFFAELNGVDVCDSLILTDKEKECIVQHLIFSSNIKHLWKYGDAILEGIFNCKRKRKRLLYDKVLRRIVRTVRKLAKYEITRSCLEGLLFDQIKHIDDTFGFTSIGVEGTPFMLTHIYFSTNTWDHKMKYEKEIEFDRCDDVTTMDYLKIFHFLFTLENVLNDITKYITTLEDTKWQQRVMRSLWTIKKNHQMLWLMLQKTPEPFQII